MPDDSTPFLDTPNGAAIFHKTDNVPAIESVKFSTLMDNTVPPQCFDGAANLKTLIFPLPKVPNFYVNVKNHKTGR
jgi:hypothetical protein